jgi:ribosomal protein L17
MKKRTSQRNSNRSEDRRKSYVKNFNSGVVGRTRVNTSMNKDTRPPTNHKVIDSTRNDHHDQRNLKSRVSVYQYFLIYLIKFGF